MLLSPRGKTMRRDYEIHPVLVFSKGNLQPRYKPCILSARSSLRGSLSNHVVHVKAARSRVVTRWAKDCMLWYHKNCFSGLLANGSRRGRSETQLRCQRDSDPYARLDPLGLCPLRASILQSYTPVHIDMEREPQDDSRDRNDSYLTAIKW